MPIHPTALVEPGARLADDVDIGPWAWIGDGVQLGAGVRVGAHAVIKGPTEIGEGSRVFHHAVLGEDPQDLKYRGEPSRLVIGAHNVFREFTTVNRGTAHGGALTRIGDHNLFMAYSHVAHDCRVGSHCVFANAASLAGHVVIEDHAVIGGLAGVHQWSRVGRSAMLGAGGMAAQDIPPFTLAQGDRARLFGLNLVGLRRKGMALPTLQALKAAYRELFHTGQPLRIALEQAREVYVDIPEVIELVDFIEGSRRGVCRSAGAEVGPE